MELFVCAVLGRRERSLPKAAPPGCVPARTPTTSNEEQRRVNYASDGGGTPNAGQIFGELRNVERLWATFTRPQVFDTPP
jgi:hypothetical protein